MLRLLGMVAMMAGDLDASKLRFVEALRIAQQIEHRIAQYYSLAALGWHAASSGQARLGAQLLGAAETVATGGRRDHLRTVSPLARRSQRVGGCSTRGIEVRGRIQDRQALEPRGGITPGTWRIRSRRGRDRTHRGGATGEAGG